MKQENRLFSSSLVTVLSICSQNLLQEEVPDSAAAWIIVVETGRYRHPGMFCLDARYTYTTSRN